jgi:hypothetical protein
LGDPNSIEKAGHCATHLFTVGSINRRNVVQSELGKNRAPISKITRTKRARDMAQPREHLPSKCETLRVQTPVLPTKREKKSCGD